MRALRWPEGIRTPSTIFSSRRKRREERERSNSRCSSQTQRSPTRTRTQREIRPEQKGLATAAGRSPPTSTGRTARQRRIPARTATRRAIARSSAIMVNVSTLMVKSHQHQQRRDRERISPSYKWSGNTKGSRSTSSRGISSSSSQRSARRSGKTSGSGNFSKAAMRSRRRSATSMRSAGRHRRCS
jgi:hypothetical protein